MARYSSTFDNGGLDLVGISSVLEILYIDRSYLSLLMYMLLIDVFGFS